MSIGPSGEDLACSHLRKKGYRIIERNFRCKLGEIDIIALKDDILVFCEVKTRQNKEFGEPFEAVTTHKQNRLRMIAQFYLLTHPKANNVPNLRFDVLSILLNQRGKQEILHMESAF
ncbi:MAG: YraN family protein [Actinomycetota bacterium]|nr:YraN family protein [Actinomycetota bacterium]